VIVDIACFFKFPARFMTRNTDFLTYISQSFVITWIKFWNFTFYWISSTPLSVHN